MNFTFSCANIPKIFRINKLFEPYFDIKKIYFGNIGVNIFKVELLAIKAGEINDKNKIEIKIKIKEKDDYVENEMMIHHLKKNHHLMKEGKKKKRRNK